MADAPRGAAREALLDSLRDAAGPGVLLEDATAGAAMQVDHHGRYHGRALAVAMPRSVDEVAKLLAWCHARRVGVVPQGGNTGYCGGATPDDSGTQLVLGLRRLNRVRELDAANFSLTVEAGCTLAEVQQAAAGSGRFFPLELGSALSCQIGGNLATNAGGLNVLRFGMARDLALGIEAVLADGRVLSRLRSLRKDNSGYDLRNLLIGSEGTLAVITAATLRLWPPLVSTATALVALTDVAAAVALLEALRTAAGERLNSFELLPRSALELSWRHLEGGLADPFPAPHAWYALCELRSFALEPLDELLAASLDAATAASVAQDAVLCGSERQRAALWRLRENIPAAQRRAGASLKHDIAVPVARLPPFVAEASAWVASSVPAATLVAYGHAGDGNLHFNLSFPADASATSVAALEPGVRRAIHDLAIAHGGSFSAEHGVGRLKVDELQRYGSPVELALMRELKRAFDPHGIMNPGKVLPES